MLKVEKRNVRKRYIPRFVCVCVCVCVRERERGDLKRERK